MNTCIKLILVGTSPKVLSALKNQSVIVPNEVTIECEISLGDPPAKLHWYKESRELYDGKKYAITYRKGSAILSIRSTDSLDDGIYTCEAANKLGRVVTEGKLLVKSKI